MICFFWTFYSKIVQTELQGSLESAKILKCRCQCAILFEWSVSQTETLVFWETLGSFNFCLENAWTWKGRWHHCLGGFLGSCFFEVDFFKFLGDHFDVFWGFLGNIGCRFQEGLGSSFSRENMSYFGSWILTHISLVFWLVQLHAIPDIF